MKQLSVFLENREGRLEEALSILKQEEINIISLSLADTTDYGMLRLIVSDADKGKEALRNSGFSAHISDVIAIKLPHVSGTLHQSLSLLKSAQINVEYMYALCTRTDEAALVFKTSDNRKAEEVFRDGGYKAFTDEDLF